MSEDPFQVLIRPHDDGRCSMIVEVVAPSKDAAKKLADALVDWLTEDEGGWHSKVH